MLPIQNIYIYNQHTCSDPANNTYLKMICTTQFTITCKYCIIYYTYDNTKSIFIPLNQVIIIKACWCTRRDEKCYFRTIETRTYNIISFNQAIIDAMNTAYTKVNNAYPTHFTAESDKNHNIIKIETNRDQSNILTGEEATNAANYQFQLFDTASTLPPKLPLSSVNMWY